MNFAEIIALIQALPAILECLIRFGQVLERLAKYTKQNDLNNFISDLEKGVDQLENAKSTDEELEGAQIIVNLVHELGPK